MSATYIHHRITAAPLRWRAVAERLAAQPARLAAAGGVLYGVWRSQIGRPRDELTAITAWSEPRTAEAAQRALLDAVEDVRGARSEAMAPTLRPYDSRPPTRQGNYAFRW